MSTFFIVKYNYLLCSVWISYNHNWNLFIYLSQWCVNHTCLKTPSIKTWYSCCADAMLLPTISGRWLWTVCCGSPLSIKEGGVHSVADVDPVQHGALLDYLFLGHQGGLEFHVIVLFAYLIFNYYYGTVFLYICKKENNEGKG